jgi:hypothetical protein
VPKGRTTRKAPVKRRATRKTAAGRGKEGGSGKRAARNGRGKAAIPKYVLPARELVVESWPDIVQGLIRKAAHGGTQQAKLLVEMYNLSSAGPAETFEERKQQLCDVLMQGLGWTQKQSEERSMELDASSKPEETETL